MTRTEAGSRPRRTGHDLTRCLALPRDPLRDVQHRAEVGVVRDELYPARRKRRCGGSAAPGKEAPGREDPPSCFGSTVGVAAARERTATLESIVADIGVDRGLLISEKGFQPGGA